MHHTLPEKLPRNDQPLLLAPAALRLDANRDGTINGKDEAAPIAVTPENPWHWWINDDDDVGDLCSSDGDVPGIHGPSNYYNPYTGITTSTPDRNDSHDTVVNHRGDIVDFFPVHLDLKTVLNLLPEGGLTVKLKHAGGALNFVYTDLEPSLVGDFLKKEGMEGTINHDIYGPAFNQALRNATTETITAAGVELNAAFLKKIRDSGKTVTTGEGENQTTVTNSAKGVILLEGRSATEVPLIVEILQGTKVIGEIKLPLKLSGVEDMYRWVNLRPHVTGQSTGDPTNADQPANYPDKLTNDKTLVFLHGYSVNEIQSRGWCAEVFKRMHQSGSRAKFVGVTWRGDQSRNETTGKTPDYHVNVTNAFLTAAAFDKTLASLPGEKHLMAHSLGNMVASAAIKDGRTAVADYYAIDAAVAMEAYDESLKDDAGMRDKMRDAEWETYTEPGYPGQTRNPRRLWSTEWYQLFTDGRKSATWRDRFGPLGNMWNFYSTGEDTLESPASDAFPSIPDMWKGKLAWVGQEKAKGTGWATLALSTRHGGWGFNSGLGANPPSGVLLALFTATNESLIENPVFLPLSIPRMHSRAANWGDPLPPQTRAILLGGAIPALSFPAGSNPMNIYQQPGQQNRNKDMMDFRPKKNPNGGDGAANILWPRSAISDTGPPKPWLHCDFRDVAFFYTWEFYEDVVNKGNFK